LANTPATTKRPEHGEVEGQNEGQEPKMRAHSRIRSAVEAVLTTERKRNFQGSVNDNLMAVAATIKQLMAV